MTGTGDGYSNPDLLWAPQRLHERLGEGGVQVLDVRFGEAFAAGHVPGAHHFSVYGVNVYDTDEAPLASFARMWAFLVGLRGVRETDCIVVYENDTGQSAARAFWCLEWLGHRDVHVLDGGLGAWTRAGFESARDAQVPKMAPYRHEAIRDRVATYRDVLAAIDDPGRIVVDARSLKEHTGEDAKAARNGAIPNSVHLDWNEHLAADGTMKQAGELRALFELRGITPDKDVIALCNTGYRSAHTYLALRLLGYPRVRNYVGSWQEWGNREGCPVITPG